MNKQTLYWIVGIIMALILGYLIGNYFSNQIGCSLQTDLNGISVCMPK